MASQVSNNQRIAKNTILLYIRMLFTMAVSLYTSRVVLQVLGEEDFGIYNVVGGVVGMCSLLTGSLSAAITRFLTFELGRHDHVRMRRVFSSAMHIQLFMALLILLLAESGGVWFLNHKMNMDPSRLPAAHWVLQASILTFIVNLISVPYNALIIAYERMKAFAYISILEALLKLLVVCLLCYAKADYLIVYALALSAVALIIRWIYQLYCRKNFEECIIQWRIDQEMLRQMFGFAGWNFIGASSAVLKEQGVNIVINLFCGPAVNAARAVSVQVNNAINAFVTNFMTALNPQITKLYAAGSYEYMHKLMQQGARLSFYLILFFSLPVWIETETILGLWLAVVPERTVLFVRLILLLTLCETLSGTLITAMLATGKIRNYQLTVGGLQMLNFPVSYILLRCGYFPEITMVVAIVISLVCLTARLLFLRSMIGLSPRVYLVRVVGNVFGVATLSIIAPLSVACSMADGWLRFVLVTLVSVVSTFVVIYHIGCSPKERTLLLDRFVSLKNKLLP